MSKPTPGKRYETIKGDTLNKIALRAYGVESKSTMINDANTFQEIITVSEELPVGTSMLIPVDNDLYNLRQQQLRNGLAGAV